MDMPSQHRYAPISIRPPEQLRDWLLDYAKRHGRPVRAVVTEALEEYRARHDQEEDKMQTVTTALATDYLYRAFVYNFLQPDQGAGEPIWFPGIAYNSDGTLADGMKTKATQHLIEVLRGSGCIIFATADADAPAALHHVLWDRWTKEEIGNGRFVGCLFDDHGKIYSGSTAITAANYTVERLKAQGCELRSYTVQEDGPL
jgi:hypothetical protein